MKWKLRVPFIRQEKEDEKLKALIREAAKEAEIMMLIKNGGLPPHSSPGKRVS